MDKLTKKNFYLFIFSSNEKINVFAYKWKRREYVLTRTRLRGCPKVWLYTILIAELIGIFFSYKPMFGVGKKNKIKEEKKETKGKEEKISIKLDVVW